LLFEIVNTEGMRRRRRAEFDTSNAGAFGIRGGISNDAKPIDDTKHALVIGS
jgi:hypothetical protein